MRRWYRRSVHSNWLVAVRVLIVLVAAVAVAAIAYQALAMQNPVAP